MNFSEVLEEWKKSWLDHPSIDSNVFADQQIVLHRVRLLADMIEAAKRLPTKSRKVHWITINFKPSVSLQEILLVLKRLEGRSFMKEYWYNIEQRGTESVHGLHSHWLVKTSHPTAQLKRDIFSTVRNLVGNIEHVDVRSYPDSYMQDKLDYLNGSKWDEDKTGKVLLDKRFRLENNLKDIYTNASV